MLVLYAIAGCGKSSDSPFGPGGPATTTTMTGVMLNAVENGRLTVSIATATLAPPAGARAAQRTLVTASGTYRPVGHAVVALSGTYDATTDSLRLAGGGYTIEAQVEPDGTPPSTVGEYEGPNGPGFFGALSTSGGTVQVFCGSYQSNTTAEGGNLAYLVMENRFAGVAFSSNTSAVRSFDGTASGVGTSRNLSGTGGQDGVDSLSIVGTYNTATGASSGFWSISDLGGSPLDAGSWNATQCP